MKKVTLVMLALTAVMQLPAQEQGRTLSLEEALEMTLSDNPAIRAAEFNRRAAQQERRAAIGLRMPQIGITGSYAYLGKDIEIDLNNMKAPVQNLAGQILQSGMIPSDYIPSISQMLSGAMAASWALPLQDRSLGFVGGDVTVPLWMGGKINAANRAARINEQTARSQGIQQRTALVSELVERYYGLALARQVVVVRQQVVDGVRKHLEDAAALEAQGMISRSEKLYVEFKMSEAERDLQNAQSQVETIAAALNSTIGQTDDYQPVTAMFILERIEPLDHFRTLAAERNPLLDQVDQKRRLAYEGVRAQRSSFLPQVVAAIGMVAGLVLLLFAELLAPMVDGKPWKPVGGMGNYLMQSVFELLETVLSYLSNTISFLRVGAFVIVHASMMMVVFTLAGTPNNILVVILGNLVVICLEALLSAIQGIRLEFYEMFSRCYKGGGRKFTAFNIKKA